MKGLIIIGCSDYNTLGCIRGFWQKGVDFTLLLVSDEKRKMILKSQAVKDYVVVATEEEAVKWLLGHADEANGTVLLPTSDKAESIIDLHSEELGQYYMFPHAKHQGEVTHMMDKDVQVEMAQKAGLSVPKTAYYHRGDAIPEGIAYPAIVKQERSTEGRKRKMLVCNDESNLKHAIEHLQETNDFLIQQYVRRDYELLLIGCRLSDGRVWMPAVFKKERWMLKGGDGSFGLISTKVLDYFKQTEEVERLLEEMNYYGPFSIEFGVEHGKPYFYEVNMRNDGTSHYYYPAGVYVPYVYYLDRIGELNEIDLATEEKEHYFIDELGDIRNFFHGLSLHRWLKDIRKANAYKFYWKGDNAPFCKIVPRSIAKSIYRMFFG